MYLNPFWGGVLATLFAELAGLFVWAVILSREDSTDD